MTTFRMVVIGATGTAAKRTLPALRESVLCTITALQARDTKRLEAVGAEFGVARTYTDTAEMLASEDFDLIFIATPPFLHRGDIEHAATTGKPIICEKPLAESLQSALRIHRTLLESGTSFMLAHHLRHQPAIETVRSVVSAGGIGESLAASAHWGFELNRSARNAAWKSDPRLGGPTAFYDAGIHVLDLILYLFGMPINVVAVGFSRASEVVTDVAAMLSYDRLTITVSASQSMRHPCNDLVILGTHGRVEVPNVFSETPTRELNLVEDGEASVRTFRPANLYRAEVENFIRHYLLKEEGAPPGTTLADALAGMTVLGAIDTALATGRSVRLGEVEPQREANAPE